MPPQDGATLDAYIDYIASVLQVAAAHYENAFKALSQDEMNFVLMHRREVFDAVLEYKMPSYDPQSERTRNLLKICSILLKIDRAELLNQFRCASLLTSRQFLDAFRKAADKLPDNGIVAKRDTPYGPIVIAGRGKNRHEADAAVLIDLGGDDEYFNNQATSVPGSIPTAILIDMAGNDAYESTDDLSQGCGALGVGILMDCNGDDSYLGMQFAQGIGYGGIGMLIENSGNDVYRALTFSQGCAFFGYGVLADASGDDRYDAKQTSQGVGLPRGFGMVRDTGGKNNFYCKGDMITSYGTRGRFSGWCQGFGFGLRPYASGGVGILFTNSGSNRMEGGDFCQGGGYYCSLGMLISAGKADDMYIGTRYAQGFGVHQAAGAFLECGGNDTYRTRHCVAQGLAWDEAICSFVDEEGNDSYDGSEGFSLGSSAHNAICLFHDAAGTDLYATAVAVSSNNTYHGGTSLTLFLDSGGSDDNYPNKKNNTIEAYPENVVFIDK